MVAVQGTVNQDSVNAFVPLPNCDLFGASGPPAAHHIGPTPATSQAAGLFARHLPLSHANTGEGKVRNQALVAGLAATLMTAAPAVTAPPGADTSEFETAIADHNFSKARTILQRFVEARLPKATGHPDPLLDRMLATLLATEDPVSGTGILMRIVNDPAAPAREHYRVMLAASKEARTEFQAAEQDYSALAADPGTQAEDRASALLGLARIQMIRDPAAAVASLSAINRATLPPAMLWELDLLTARAASMAGPDDAGLATAARDRAWSEAASSALGDGAAAHVAGDLALAAARAGDRKRAVTLLAVDRFNRSANEHDAMLAADLPACGQNGLQPSDRVVLDVGTPRAGRPSVTLAWANRAGIAGPFLKAAKESFFTIGDGQAASVALSCRTMPHSDYVVRTSVDDRVNEWMTGQGAYPLTPDTQLTVAALGPVLATRQARYGATSPMLLPVLTLMLAATSSTGIMDDPTRQQIATLAHQIDAILTTSHAPADLVLLWQLTTIGSDVLAQKKSAAAAQPEVQALLTAAAGNAAISLDVIYGLATSTAASPTLPNSFKETILEASLDLLAKTVPPSDQRAAALALRLYGLRKASGNAAGAAAAIQPLRLAPDLCIFSDPAPHFVSSNIVSDDYPGDLTFASIVGSATVEFDLDAGGVAHNPRLLVSDPPDAFDEITRARIPTIRYEPPRIGGQIVACRGFSQTVRWQLPY